MSGMTASSQDLPALGAVETCDAAEPAETAKAAGLRYVTGASPGLKRKHSPGELRPEEARVLAFLEQLSTK